MVQSWLFDDAQFGSLQLTAPPSMRPPSSTFDDSIRPRSEFSEYILHWNHFHVLSGNEYLLPESTNETGKPLS